MKNLMKNWPLFIALGLVLSFSSCKKSDTTPADNSVSAADDATVTNAIAANSDDAALAADGSFSRGAGGANAWGLSPCGGTVTVDSATKTITIVYDGSTVCGGVYRTGTITVTLTGANSWKDAGATVTVATTGLKITDPVTLGYYTISGSHSVTNESGGVLGDLIASNDTITRRHFGSLEVTFANNTTRTWTFDRTRAWSTFMSGGQKYLNVSLYTEAGDNVEATGFDRFNQQFTDKITTAVQADNYKCSGESKWDPYSGAISHSVNNRATSVLFGTNSSGGSVGTQTYCPSGSGVYGYYITYVNSNDNVTRYKFVSYWHY